MTTETYTLDVPGNKIVSNLVGTVAHLYGHTVSLNISDTCWSTGDQARAEFIIRALNNHDALVNVLRDLTRSIGSVENTRSKYQQAIELLDTL